MTKKILFRTVIGILCVFWLALCIFPFVFMVLTTFKTHTEMMSLGVFSLPSTFKFDNYVSLLENSRFLRYVLNSMTVVPVSLLLILVVSSMASYPLGRLKYRFHGLNYSVILAGMAIPIHVTLIPVFLMTKKLGLYDSIWALVGPYVAFNIPLSVFILAGFMAGIPHDLEEAAEIDGCGRVRTFLSVILPLTIPGMATLAIYNSVIMWNEFSFALVLTQSEANRTLPMAMWDYKGRYTSNTPMIMTILTLSSIPMIIAFFIGQDKLIKGMIAGAVKG